MAKPFWQMEKTMKTLLHVLLLAGCGAISFAGCDSTGGSTYCNLDVVHRISIMSGQSATVRVTNERYGTDATIALSPSSSQTTVLTRIGRGSSSKRIDPPLMLCFTPVSPTRLPVTLYIEVGAVVESDVTDVTLAVADRATCVELTGNLSTATIGDCFKDGKPIIYFGAQP